MLAKMETYLSTLAGVNATILAIFGAAFAAYIVFLQERTAQFNDTIAQDKVEISSQLAYLGGQLPESFRWYLPIEFEQAYQKNSGKAGSELVVQAITDVIFENDTMATTVNEVLKYDNFSGPWKGRVFYWTLTQATRVLTISLPGRPTPRPQVFPVSPNGAGFDEWRRDSEKVLSALKMLEGFKERNVADFRAFLDNQPDRLRNDQLSGIATKSTEAFFSNISRISASLSDIDKQLILGRRYELSRTVHTVSVLALLLLTTIIGIVAPLIFLATNITVTPILNVSILFASLFFSVATFWQFGKDISSKPRENYLESRWLEPLQEQITANETSIREGAFLDLQIFIEASKSPESAGFGRKLTECLKQYIKNMEDYNASTDQLTMTVVDFIRHGVDDGRFSFGDPTHRGAAMLNPVWVLDRDKVEFIVRHIQNNDVDLSIETRGSYWSRVKMRLSRESLDGNKINELLKIIDSARNTIESNGQAEAFLQSKGNLLAAGEQLTKLLEKR